MCFLVNFAEFLRSPILNNIRKRLLLSILLKIHVSERKYKSNLKNHESLKYFTIFMYIMLMNIGPLTRDHVKSSQMWSETPSQL